MHAHTHTRTHRECYTLVITLLCRYYLTLFHQVRKTHKQNLSLKTLIWPLLRERDIHTRRKKSSRYEEKHYFLYHKHSIYCQYTLFRDFACMHWVTQRHWSAALLGRARAAGREWLRLVWLPETVWRQRRTAVGTAGTYSNVSSLCDVCTEGGGGGSSSGHPLGEWEVRLSEVAPAGWILDRTHSSTRLQMCCQSPWYPVKDRDLVVIAGNFVSCYRCAGEGSVFSRGGGGWWGCWSLSRPPCAVQAEPEPETGSASFIYFFDTFLFFSLLIYTAVTFKIQSRWWI